MAIPEGGGTAGEGFVGSSVEGAIILTIEGNSYRNQESRPLQKEFF
jgi:hypothetical protein